MRRLVLAFAVSLAAVAAAPAETADKTAPQSAAELHLSFAPVVKKVRPAVVNVYASRVERQARNPLFDDPIFRQFFGDQGEESRVAQSLGSGVIVDASGLIVTNHHVIEGMTDVKVALSDRREFPAKIVLRDPHSDLAVLKIELQERFPVLELGDSDAIEVGDIVLAVGDPFGVGQTVTQGIVSALARTQIGINDYGFFIQTDAAINPGNSGGALVDLDGRLIGVNSAIVSRSGGSVGIGFAIPVNMVKSVIYAAEHGGVVRRPWLGASLQDVTKDIANSIGLERPAGALIASVAPEGPADQGGLKRGDVVTAIDGQGVDDAGGVGFRLGVQAARRRGDGDRIARRQDGDGDGQADRGAGNAAARRDPHQEPLAVRGRAGGERLAGGVGRTVAARTSTTAWSSPRPRRVRWPPISAFRKATSCAKSTAPRSARPATSKRRRASGRACGI